MYKYCVFYDKGEGFVPLLDCFGGMKLFSSREYADIIADDYVRSGIAEAAVSTPAYY